MTLNRPGLNERAAGASDAIQNDYPEPFDIEADEMDAFILRDLPRQRCKLLEIGGGSHRFACRLAKAGHGVHVVDASGRPLQMERHDSLTVDSVHPEHLELGAHVYDAVIFENGIRHFDDIDLLIDQISVSLISRGLLFVEDVDHGALSEKATQWYRLTLNELRNRGYIHLTPDHDLERAIFAGQTFCEYFEQRGLSVRPAVELIDSMERRFRLESERPVPYLYRLFANIVPRGEPGARLVRSFLAQESAAIEQGLLEPVGRRAVALKQ